MTLEELKEKGWVCLEVLSGSRAYGLATPTSDTDIHGLYVLPLQERLRYSPVMWVNSEKNDHMYWDLAKFIQLLAVANPGALEMLYSPAHCILSSSTPNVLGILKNYPFVTKACQGSFVRYAESQLKRARGLNKKVFNPVDKERKSVLDFCYVNFDKRASIPLKKAMEEKQWNQEFLALAAMTHMKGSYILYYQDPGKVREDHGGLPRSEVPGDCLEDRFAYGVVKREQTSNDVQVCSIPKVAEMVGILTFNADAYQKYCRDYHNYWSWVENRNEDRYQGTVQHGGGYDAKNMMHVYRLLHTAKDIALGKGVIVDRSFERDFLLGIKAGKYSYDEIYNSAMELIEEVDDLFQKSSLPENPPSIDEVLWEVLNQVAM